MYRCPECRTRRKSWHLMQAHILSSGHRLCTCGGYHYAHRRYSTFCYDNPMSAYWHASRAGATEEELEDIQIECALNAPGRPLKVWPYESLLRLLPAAFRS